MAEPVEPVELVGPVGPVGPVELALVGAGLRGARSYGPVALAHPDELRFTVVVEPNEARRRWFARAHGIEPERQFARVEDWLAAGCQAEAVLVATPDDAHVAPTLAALKAGYDVLVEKPLAPTAAECIQLVAAAEAAGRDLQVCHVLRYTEFFRRLHEVVISGVLGDLVSVEHRENIAFWHMAHSYVRGAYADTSVAAPLLLAKCCHDLDVMCWNLAEPCVRVSSSGSLRHFRPERAPAGAPERCTDGCPVEGDCAFSAPFVYLGERQRVPAGSGGAGSATDSWRPVTPFAWMALTDHGELDPTTAMLTESSEERLAALRTGPYGRCVYRCRNDALDNQIVTMELASGTAAVLAITGHAHDDERTLRYDGSRATLLGRFSDFSGSSLTVHHHRSGRAEEIAIDAVPGLHGGGDVGLLRAYAAGRRGSSGPRTGAREALTSHLLGFAAEHARHSATVVDVSAFQASLGWEGASRA